MYMRVIKDDDDSISFNAWWNTIIKQYNIKDLHVFNTENSIVFIDTEALLRICEWLSGEKELPSLSQGEDILGDINSCDLEEEISFEYYESSVDLNDIVDTRGCIGHHHNVFGHSTTIRDSHGEYNCEYYSHRKGYPSFMFKTWEGRKEQWVE